MFVRFEEIRVVDAGGYNKVPLTCNVCDQMLRRTDINIYMTHECCEDCWVELAQPNMQKWKNGWRPSSTEINRMLKNKKKLNSYMMRGL